MPGMNGANVARLVRAERSSMPVLFIIGFADRTALAGVGRVEIISKPFIDDELADKAQLAPAEGASKKVVRLRRSLRHGRASAGFGRQFGGNEKAGHVRD
jgi:FixJ family two-component response regulator